MKKEWYTLQDAVDEFMADFSNFRNAAAHLLVDNMCLCLYGPDEDSKPNLQEKILSIIDAWIGEQYHQAGVRAGNSDRVRRGNDLYIGELKVGEPEVIVLKAVTLLIPVLPIAVKDSCRPESTMDFKDFILSKLSGYFDEVLAKYLSKTRSQDIV